MTTEAKDEISDCIKIRHSRFTIIRKACRENKCGVKNECEQFFDEVKKNIKQVGHNVTHQSILETAERRLTRGN